MKALVPVIAISEKATVTPASGVAQDFSGGKSVVYTVVAEDGTSRKYTASIEGVQNIMKYSLDEWSEFDAGNSYDIYWPPGYFQWWCQNVEWIIFGSKSRLSCDGRI